jgi:hypothetical protein
MVDDDMIPDWRLNTKRGPIDPTAKPFLDVALPFVLQHEGPCCVGAPYCGPPPIENVYVFKPTNWRAATRTMTLASTSSRARRRPSGPVSRKSSRCRQGVYLIDMRCVANLAFPHFQYEYSDPRQIKKATTEDVYFSRNLAVAGVPQYCAWDCWAGHIKPIVVDKPELLTMDAVRDTYRAAILRGQVSTEKLIMLGDDKPKSQRRKKAA